MLAFGADRAFGCVFESRELVGWARRAIPGVRFALCGLAQFTALAAKLIGFSRVCTHILSSFAFPAERHTR